eukprot:scaffold6653_cov71-Skeletonema_dohrnii-CCMP3373.AAC.6
MRMFFTAVHLAMFFKGWINSVRQKRQPILILFVRHLFIPLNSEYAQMELVDMVNNNGDVLGQDG